MDTIRNYLEQMFRSLPQNEKVLKAKSELFQMMEDKFYELIKEGKTENEAVGTVISEFGNLEELVEDLGIKDIYATKQQNERNKKLLSFDEIKNFLKERKKIALIRSLGIVCYITCVAFPIIGDALNIHEELFVSAMFLCSGIGVALFVISATIKKNIKYIYTEGYSIDSIQEDYLKQERTKYISTYSIMKSIGILLCILSIIPPIILDGFFDSDLMDNIGGAAIFLFVALGVFFIVYSSNIKRAYDRLLSLNGNAFYYERDTFRYKGKIKYKNQKVETVMSVFWQTVTCIYLCISFLTNAWHITWIIWPISGVLSSILRTIFMDKNEDGTKTFQDREINEIKIRKVFNKYPRRHVQDVELTDNNGDIAVSSQNLINYKYYKIKTVTESYRNEEQYVDGWANWIETNGEDLMRFSDRDLVQSLNNRINGIKKTVANSLINAFTPAEHSDLSEYGTDYDTGDVTSDVNEDTEALINITMEYPEEVLSLALYIYERELVANSQENEVWIWNYSVNNYFKTDNEKMDGYEYFQKYMYIAEEINSNNTFFKDNVLGPILDEYNESRPWYAGASVDVNSISDQMFKSITANGGMVSPYVTGASRGEVFWETFKKYYGDNILNPLSTVNFTKDIMGAIKNKALQLMGKQVNQEDLGDLLEKVSGNMHTAYLNLGTVRKSVEEEGGETYGGLLYQYIPNYNETTASETQFVIGKDISGKDRGGEGSLVPTFKVNEDLLDEAIHYSYRNYDGSAPMPSDESEMELSYSTDIEAVKTGWNNFKEAISSWWNGREAEYENVPTYSFKIPVTPEEHEHYQYEYFIEPTSYGSGVFDSSGDGKTNELPLEVRSVRDYGLASILNYVDSITVEFYSGAWYDEVYLRKEIGEALISSYSDVYSTYSFSKDNWFDKTSSSVHLKADYSGKAISNNSSYTDFNKAVNIVANGYYPKEMREDASDKIIELFEQNNKKRLFMDLVNSIDGKIFEVTNEYDQVMWDEEKKGELVIGDKSFNLLTGDFYALDKPGALDEVPFNVDVVNDALVGNAATFRLLDKEGNPIGADDFPFEDNQIYRITNEDSKFYYYMPEIKYAYEKVGAQPNRITQLLIPKRYYRNWVKTLTLNDDNGEEWPPDKVLEMSLLDRIRTLILRRTVIPEGEKKSVLYLKTADVSLPSSNIDAILRGLAVKGTGFSIGPEKEYNQSNLPTSIPGTGTYPSIVNPYEIRYEYNAGKNASPYYGRSPYQMYSDGKWNEIGSQSGNGAADSNYIVDKLTTETISTGMEDSASQDVKYYNSKGELKDNWYNESLRYTREGEAIHRTLFNNSTWDVDEKKYYQFILNTYSSTNFKSGINRFDYITDADVEKVFVIDEVATFTGRFMYTYKDTLLATGDSLDPDTTKGVLSAYAMDRYIFLDSWDIKLLTEEIIDVSFMWMNVQPTVEEQSVSQYIKTRNDSKTDGKEGNVLDALKQFLMSFLTALKVDFANNSHYDQFYDNTFLYAVPAKYVDEIKSWDGDTSGSHWTGGTQERKEVEAYTSMIFSGFMFYDTNLPDALRHATDSVHSDFTGPYEETFDLLSDKIEYKMDDAILNGMSDEAIASYGGASAEGFISSISDATDSYGNPISISDSDRNAMISSWNRITSASTYEEANQAIYDFCTIPTVYTTLKDEGNDGGDIYRQVGGVGLNDYNNLLDSCKTIKQADGTTNISETEAADMALTFYKAQAIGVLNAMGSVCSKSMYSYDYPYNAPSKSLIDSAKEAIVNLAADIANALLELCTGFRITSEEYSLCAKVDTSYLGIHLNSNGIDNGIDLSEYNTNFTDYILPSLFNRYIKIMGYKEEGTPTFGGFDFNFEVFESGDWQKGGTGKAVCYSNIYTYSLKCSDEIANKVMDGRYYSFTSSLNLDFEQDNNLIDGSIKNVEDATFVKDWSISNPLVTSTNYGSLVNIRAEQLIKDLKGKGIYDNTIKIEGFNGGPTYKTSLEDLWRPQVKIFDNFNDYGYDKDSMKELLYGAYLKNNGAVNEGAINISSDTAVDSSGNYKNGVHLHKVEGTAGTNKNFFFRFIQNAFDDTAIRDSLINVKPVDGLMGFKLWEESPSSSFIPDKATSREENNFQDKFQDVYLDKKVAAINPIEVLFEGKDSKTQTSDNADKFVAFLNKTYGEDVKDIVLSAHYAFQDGETKVDDINNEQFAITGFVLVPRLTDRRDEPTLYPLYRYYGGSKKKIIPEEQVKYFEGLTYDSWKNKMTIKEDSPSEKIDRYLDEMQRLSNYIYTYFNNFEAYVPYNVISDSDLEIRGTAGYADLLTQYTLYPVETIAYTNLFVSEANKPYWNDICTTFEIPNTVIAQLLQGIAETRLKYIGEDSAALMVKQDGVSYDSNLVEEISSRTRELIGASRAKEGADGFISHVQITTDGGQLIPILGIMGIDNIPDKDNTTEIPEEHDSSSTGATAKNIVEGGIMLTNHSGASASHGLQDVITGSSASDLYSKVGSLDPNAEKVLISLSAKDVQNSGSPDTGVDTVEIRRLIKAVTHAAPNAKIYFFPITPVVGNTVADDGVNMNNDGYNPAPWTAETLNAAVDSANNKIKEYIEENIPNGTYVTDATDSILSDAATARTDYTTDKCSLNNSGFNKLLSGASDIMEDEEAPEYYDKSTYYFAPMGEKTKPYEIAFNIYGRSLGMDALDENSSTDSIHDGRLVMEDAIQYASVRLYKSTNTLGDLLKAVYASFYSDKFVKALIVVTEDNATNLARDAEHGLWYRPTENDILAAFELLNDDDKELINWRENIPHDSLTEIYGINRLQEAFSYIKNQSYRKTLVTYAMTSGGSNSGLEGITLDGDWEVGANAEATKVAAQKTITGTSLVDGRQYSSSMIDYITTVCSNFSTPEQPLDPALVMALIMVESGGDPNITQHGGGPGRGLAQHSMPGGLSATATTSSGGTVSINFPYDKAFDPVASIDYIVMNYAQKLQEASYQMHPLTAIKTHNLPVTLDARLEFADKYPLTPEGDLAYLWAYENGQEYQGYHRTHVLAHAGRAASVTEAEYRTMIPQGENFGYGCPRYCTRVLAFYVEEYANGDLFSGVMTAGNRRDYSEEIWEEEYLKYQNSGVELITGYVNQDDVDQLVQMTANYRNNNTEQSEYGYTYLDFFREVPSIQNGSNEFTGDMADSLLLNAMTYLGAHYSQGRAKDAWNGVVYSRTSHGENLGGGPYSTPWGANSYGEGTFAAGNKWAFDCSSFGAQMYAAMGYDFTVSTCSTYNSTFGAIKVGNATSVELKPGDLLVSGSHTIIWMGPYTANYNGLFDESTLRILGAQIVRRSGTEVLNWANSNVVGKDAYIHSGGYRPGGSCVNIKNASKGYLSGFNVYRFFRDDLDYNQASLSAVSPLLCPTIFTKTTIRNNPYLVEYMENSGILEAEMAKGQFDAGDVAEAQAKINSVRGDDTSDGDYEGDEYEISAEMLRENLAVKNDNSYF